MSDWTQEGRPFRLYTPLGKDVLLLTSWEGYERISRLYRFTVSAISTRSDIEPKELLLKTVHLALRLPDGTDRKIYGIVSHFSRDDTAPVGYVAYHLEIVPAQWALDLDTGFEIFQNKSAREVCEKLLTGTPHDWKLLRTLEPRPYCFRYRESRWNTVARLLEQEGIWYRFEHKSDEPKMILSDSVASAQPAWGVSKLVFSSSMLSDPRVFDLRMDSSPFVAQTRVRTASEFLPKQNVGDMTSSTGAFTPPADLKAYRFEQQMTEHRTGITHSGGEMTSDVQKLAPDTKVYSRLRQELAEAMAVRYSGASEYVGLEVGAKTTISKHPNAAMNGDVFITSISHSGRNASYDGGDRSEMSYANRFEAIPAATPYRPERLTPWPNVGGSHVGTVVGPDGEEIYTDKHGRVQVVFKWDVDDSKALDHSCWIRVAQSFAGNRYGMVFLPRIGHEVLVEFLDGNPDNPIVVGSLYNAQNLPPWPLPDNKTQTGVRTHSTLRGGADNFNELRFEDKITEELIYVQAEKDLSTLVKNDETRLVKHDRTTTIHNNEEKTVEEGYEKTTVKKGEQIITVSDNNRTLYVEKDNNITVNANETIKITNNRDVTVNASQTHTIAKDNTVTISGKQEHTITKDDSKKVKEGNSKLEVSQGNISVKASLGSITIEAMQKIEIKVAGNSIVIDNSGITIKGIMVKIEGEGMAELKAPMTTVKGDGMLVLKGGITMIN